MKPLAAVIVCFAILCAVDALWFDGWYLDAATQAVEQAYARAW
jgi:hypothetical protein